MNILIWIGYCALVCVIALLFVWLIVWINDDIRTDEEIIEDEDRIRKGYRPRNRRK
jgi:hypothetical protein